MASNWTDLEEHTAIVEAVGKRCARERRVRVWSSWMQESVVIRMLVSGSSMIETGL